MPTFKLDGQEIPFEPGETIIYAAWRQGLEIPHYCWHPGLSIAANCRMCLVEIKSDRPANLPVLKWDAEKQQYVPSTKPKLLPACQTQASEGMEVFACNDEAREAQSHVQEFLLLNHPVDCPICDQSGECKLQDYWLSNQGHLKRKMTEPVHKPKGVRFGPTIVYDGERCIMCTRCIRVCDEVAGDHALDMRERGNRNEIVLSPGRELDHQYTFMTEHVCPVGALTTSDFRFKARVWFLRAAESICPGCATGCNSFIDFDPRDNRVYRLRPRDNLKVNKFWMCDDGMMTYTRIHEDRILNGIIRGEHERRCSSEEALQEAAALLSAVDTARLAVVLSAQHSSEDNHALATLARDCFGSARLYLAALGGWQGDEVLRHSDNNPNRAGATEAGGSTMGSLNDLLSDAAEGVVSGVVALGWASDKSVEELTALGRLPVISFSSNIGPLTEIARVVIPVTCHAEMDGTFVNAQGMAQSFRRAIAPPPGVQPAWESVAQLARAMGKTWTLTSLQEVRNSLPVPEQTQPYEETRV